LLSEQGERIAVVSEEAGSLFAQVGGRYSKNGDVDLDLWLKGYDAGPTRVGRISRNQVWLEHPSITAIVTPQPSVLEGLAEHPEFRGRGFIARWLFVLPQSLVGKRAYRNRPISPAARDSYVGAIKKLADLPVSGMAEMPLVHLEGDALDLWAKFHDRIEADQAEGKRLDHMRDWASKLSGKVARIAACFHLLEHRDRAAPWELPISSETVAAAWALGEFFLEHALAVHAIMGANPDVARARRICDWIRQNRLERFSRRDCHQAHKSMGEAVEFDRWLTILEDRGFIRKLPPKPSGPKGGRPPTPVWEVNPLAQNSQNSQNPPLVQGSESSEGFETGALA